MQFITYFVRRLGRFILTLFFISTVIFFIIRVVPGDPAAVIAGIDAEQEDIQNIREKLGTDKPIFYQYVDWLWRIVSLDFGDSFHQNIPVIYLIGERLQLTLLLAIMAFGVALGISIPLGVVSAVKRWTIWDYLGMVFSQFGMAIPSFWLGILLLLLFSVNVRVFPLFGSGSIRHLILPAFALSITRAAVLVRLVRGSMMEELDKEYIITARAKGLSEKTVFYKHALKNALLAVITMAGIQFGYLLGGAIIIEQVFSLPGLGRLLLHGIYNRDFPLIQAGVLVIAVIFSFTNFAVDVLYSILNPRIRVH